MVSCCDSPYQQPWSTANTSPGWKRQLGYCIAFSADGCADVTRRYVREASRATVRNKCSEGVLMHILAEIQATRRKDMDKKEKFRLMAEDMREDEEFRKNIIESLALTISRILPGGDDAKGDGSRRPDADALKIQQEAERERALQARARQQGGRGTPNLPRDQRQQ